MKPTTPRSARTKPAPAKPRRAPARPPKVRTAPRQPTRKVRPQLAASPGMEVTAAPTTGQTKKALLSALLRREAGASMPEMMQATGWLAHSVRAALTGLRRDGGTVLRRTQADGTTRYRLAEEA